MFLEQQDFHANSSRHMVFLKNETTLDDEEEEAAPPLLLHTDCGGEDSSACPHFVLYRVR